MKAEFIAQAVRVAFLLAYIITAAIADKDLGQLDALLRSYLGTGR